MIRYAAYPAILAAVLLAALAVAGGSAPAWPLLAAVAGMGIALVAVLERLLLLPRVEN